MHLLIIAILPAAVLMFLIYKCDKVEREPVSLILKVMGLGMAIIIPVVICELMGEVVISLFCKPYSILYIFLDNFLIVGLLEEFWKRLIVKKYIWNRHEFNYRFDAIVYCVASSLGFALLENILYVFQNGFGTGIVRAILSVPGHCTFAIFMGYFLGNAKLYEMQGNEKKAKRYAGLSLWVPVVLHGFYDFCLTMQSVILMLLFLVFVIVCDIFSIIRVVRSEKQDIPFYVHQEGGSWIQNPVWLEMAATSIDKGIKVLQVEADNVEQR